MEYKFTSNQRGHRSLSEEEFNSTQIRNRHFVVASKLDADSRLVSDNSESEKLPEVNKED